MSSLIRGCCLFPDRIVAGHENHASLHQGRDRIVFNREWSCCVLIVGGIGGGRLSPDDEPGGLEIFAGQSRELILVPYGLIKQRELRRAMGHRNREKIRMFERPYLRIERVAHQVEPTTTEISVVPGLLLR